MIEAKNLCAKPNKGISRPDYVLHPCSLASLLKQRK